MQGSPSASLENNSIIAGQQYATEKSNKHSVVFFLIEA